MCSCRPSRRASSADSPISSVVTENGEHGATAIWTCARRRRAGCGLGLGERVVEVLDERVGRQAAVATRRGPSSRATATMRTPSSRAARISASSRPVDAAREEVVVVEDGRAARERELGEAGARGRVLRLLVDRGPDGIERLQPGEEVGLLRARARERLVQVVVRVDEPRRDDRAAEVDPLVRLGRLAAARPRSTRPSSTSSQPPSCSVPSSSIVTTWAFVKERAHASSGTSSKRSTSTRPRSVIFRLGITDSARNASVWNGASQLAAERARRVDAGAARATTSASGASESRPGDRQRQLGAHLPAVDDDDAAAESPRAADGRSHVVVVHPDDDDVVRVVRDRRGERAALAGRSRARSPRPIRPVPRWRSITAIFARSRSGSATRPSVDASAPRRATR